MATKKKSAALHNGKPFHPINPRLLSDRVNVALIGAGGNGSMMLAGLARLDRALRKLGHPGGLHVTVYDPDSVSDANVGRQLFAPSDIGQPKATVLVNRVNLTFGLDWQACVHRYEGVPLYDAGVPGNHVLITCVDSGAARRAIYNKISVGSYGNLIYWLDMGNKADRGQVFLTQPHFRPYNQPMIGDQSNQGKPTDTRTVPLLPDLGAVLAEILDPAGDEEDDDTPSCSLAEALQRQDLFVNQIVASWALHLLWTLFRKGGVDTYGYWINLGDGRVAPVPVPSPVALKREAMAARKRGEVVGTNG